MFVLGFAIGTIVGCLISSILFLLILVWLVNNWKVPPE